jgi:hypothetical protein
MRYFNVILVIGVLVVLAVLFPQCFHRQRSVGDDPRGERYVGAAACIRCHGEITGSYAHNHHYQTSSAINSTCLKIKMAPSGGRFYFLDSSYICVEEKDGSLSQVHFVNGKADVTGKFDIAFGSGEKARTYAYWKEGKLYQLPLTYYKGMDNGWANSPGFPAGHARYDRIIESRCFECHASYVHATTVQSGPLSVSENLDSSSIVYGIDCERCHGPALQHVTFHEENPSVKTGKYIVSIKSLNRQRQLDLCAVCHSGNDQSRQRSLFAFTPGDTLSHFYYPDFGAGKGEPDVHGKQLQLLQASKCYQMTTTMTCTTCHDAHGPEENKIVRFISKCMDCHQNSAHALAILKDNEQKKRDFNLVAVNCIDCHMPLQISKTIHFNNGTELKNTPYFIRTHKISIYKSQ